MKIDELIERISKLWNGTIRITMLMKNDFSYLMIKNGKIIGQENPNTYNLAKKYDWKIHSCEMAINPILNTDLLIITLRPLSDFEKELGDEGW
jgi:hypothetical protein